MSAFIVADKTINYVVNWLRREIDRLRVHYLILTEETRPDPSWLSADSVQRPD
jgi:hypothetical protein